MIGNKSSGHHPVHLVGGRGDLRPPTRWTGVVFVIFVFFLPVLPLRAETSYVFQPGETITYAIKKLGLRVGTATLSFYGPTKLDGQDSLLIMFTAKALNFFDEEKIYMDPETFLPIRVERNLNLWGKKEKIVETYSLKKGMVTITKYAGGRQSEQILNKEKLLDNIYCFIYRYRQNGSFVLGEELVLNLPTKDILIKIRKNTKLKAAGEVFNAYYMKSERQGYRLWFDTGEAKIPLRIDGAIKFGKTALIMIDYQSSKEDSAESQ